MPKLVVLLPWGIFLHLHFFLFWFKLLFVPCLMPINFYKKYARRSLMRGDFGEVLHTCRRLLSMVPNDNETKSWRSIALEVMKN